MTASSSLVHLTPIWRKSLDDSELRNVSSSLEVTAASLKVFLAPESLDLGFYKLKFPNVAVHRMPDCNFRSISSYSFMMMQPMINDRYTDFDQMLLLQTDAVLLKPLNSVAVSHVDYVGAPWPHPLYYVSIGPRPIIRQASRSRSKRLDRVVLRVVGDKAVVGNGGLSVRRLGVFRSITQEISHRIRNFAHRGINEDVVFATLGPRLGLRVASEELAAGLFREHITLTEAERLNITGVHAPR